MSDRWHYPSVPDAPKTPVARPAPDPSVPTLVALRALGAIGWAVVAFMATSSLVGLVFVLADPVVLAGTHDLGPWGQADSIVAALVGLYTFFSVGNHETRRARHRRKLPPPLFGLVAALPTIVVVAVPMFALVLLAVIGVEAWIGFCEDCEAEDGLGLLFGIVSLGTMLTTVLAGAAAGVFAWHRAAHRFDADAAPTDATVPPPQT